MEPLTGTVPLTVTFTNLSTPTEAITSTLWTYGDGVTGTTTALTHTHAYTGAGVYTVTLSVSDGVMSDSLTRTNYITVTGGTVYTTTTRVITYTYECAASLKQSERDKLYRLIGADYRSMGLAAGSSDERRRRQSCVRLRVTVRIVIWR